MNFACGVRRLVLPALCMATVGIVCHGIGFAVDFHQYQGSATVVRGDKELEGNIASINSRQVMLKLPGSPPKTFNSSDISEIRVDHPITLSVKTPGGVVPLKVPNDTLTWDWSAKTFLSAADEQAKKSGRVKLVNKADRKVEIYITDRCDHLGKEEQIDRSKQENAQSWNLSLLPGESKFLTVGAAAVITSMLAFDIGTNEGITSKRSEFVPSSDAGDFTIDIETKDLHTEMIVELAEPWKLFQARRALDLDQGNRKFNSEIKRDEKSQTDRTYHAETNNNYGYAGLPTANYYYLPRAFDSRERVTRRDQSTRTQKDEASHDNRRTHSETGPDDGIGHLTATVVNPTSKTVEVTATVWVCLTDTKTGKEAFPTPQTEKMTFGPHEKKDWHIPVAGTSFDTAGKLIKPVDLTSVVK
jgi:hypothetical protein